MYEEYGKNSPSVLCKSMTYFRHLSPFRQGRQLYRAAGWPRGTMERFKYEEERFEEQTFGVERTTGYVREEGKGPGVKAGEGVQGPQGLSPLGPRTEVQYDKRRISISQSKGLLRVQDLSHIIIVNSIYQNDTCRLLRIQSDLTLSCKVNWNWM